MRFRGLVNIRFAFSENYFLRFFLVIREDWESLFFVISEWFADPKTQTKNQMTTIQKLKAQRPWIEIIDDETDCAFGDNGFIVTLKKEYAFALDPDCGVRGFDTISELKSGTSKKAVCFK